MADMLSRGSKILASQPFSVPLGAELVEFSPGAAAPKIPIRTELMQQHGFVHGGVVAYAADNALTFAGGSVLGTAVVTAEYKINFVRPAAGKFAIARATVIHAGKNEAVCRCEVYASGGNGESLCATAQGTVARLGRQQDD